MKLLLTTFVCIVAIALAAYQQHDIVLDYLRTFLRSHTLDTASTTSQSNKTLSTMAPSSTFVGLPVIPPNDPSLEAKSPKPRAIKTVFEAIEQAEGAGATVRRSIGTPKLRNFTPFLMLDHLYAVSNNPHHKRRHQLTT